MEDYKKIIKDRLNILPKNIQNFLRLESWRTNVSNIGKKFNFTEDQMTSSENEVFLCLICLEQTIDLKENLKRELNIDDNSARQIADSINGSVFGPVMKDIKDFWAAIPETSPNPAPQNKSPINPSVPLTKMPEAKPEMKSSIGDSYEQAVLNQAKAMQVAKPVQTTTTPVAPKPITPSHTSTPPTNLPGAEIVSAPVNNPPANTPAPTVPPTQKAPLTNTPNYTAGEDPYREPAV